MKLASDLTLMMAHPELAKLAAGAALLDETKENLWMSAQDGDAVAQEVAVSFDSGPVLVTTTHLVKSRPRAGNRRPPTRVARADQGFEQPMVHLPTYLFLVLRFHSSNFFPFVPHPIEPYLMCIALTPS